MRLDLLLVRLRFAKSRTIAQRWIADAHMRCNGQRVTRADRGMTVGDVLTLPIGRGVRVIALESLPERRGPAKEARTHYRELDARPSIAIAGAESRPRMAEHEGRTNQ
ncbi:S4 domain-containing protein [Aurantiacibacter rhizosphaerae]|uniref:RNA-binding S4 domain-containing protein n=1 Tax=Aurantiacibacter rhizosphaerae TaxID=2691582 RepID=A0A844X952_9SPHN|nr:S4 domain-containing protein [Aurantiacibacter rhizosphaerae]MWV26319.1 RNA-binding S4 domain-containing protein [Aurantiacibacter rhizosphaerae]